MRVNEFVVEGWGTALAGVAGGFLQGLTRTSGLVDKANKSSSTFAQDFVQRVNNKLRRAVAAGTVSTKPDAITVTPTPLAPHQWDSATKKLTTRDGVVYYRYPSGEWQNTSTLKHYPRNYPHAIALEKEMRSIVASKIAATKASLHANAGPVPTLEESTEPHPVYSITDYLMMLVKTDLPSKLTTTNTPIVEKICKDAQLNYAKPGEFMKSLTKLGQAVYSIATAK